MRSAGTRTRTRQRTTTNSTTGRRPIASSPNTSGYRLQKSMESPGDGPAAIKLNDQGKKAAGTEVSERVNRGEQVLALDLLFIGDMAPEKPLVAAYALKVTTTGDRPLGLEAAKQLAVARWFREAAGDRRIRLESTGIRSEVVSLAASALEPKMFSEVVSRAAVYSLSRLLDAPVEYREAPDLFCLDLYKEFDLDRLGALAEPVTLTFKYAES